MNFFQLTIIRLHSAVNRKQKKKKKRYDASEPAIFKFAQQD